MTFPSRTLHSRGAEPPRRSPIRALLPAVVGSAMAIACLVGTPASALSGSEPVRLHDPSAIVVDGCTYAFSTGFENDLANPAGAITQYRTCDQDAVAGWAKVGNTWSTTPAWISQRLGQTPPNIWAPDINYFDGEYHLYYGASVWGTATAVMGLLTAPDIEGPWTDQGMVTDVHYPIDPDVVRGEDDRLYVSWGSWTGGASYMHVVDESTGKLSSADANLWTVAKGVEGVSIVRDGDYFYMFGSKGSCCSGVNSTYYTAVARSTSVTGPYVDMTGGSMVDAAGTRVLSGYGSKIAAGGGDVFSDGDQAYFAYHYYDGEANGRETLDIRPLAWEDGWPTFGTPIGSIFATSETTLSGRPVPGQPLTGDPAEFDKPDVDVTYQWLRDGDQIPDATSSTYTPSIDDVDAQVALRVTATREGYDPGVSTSKAVTILAQPPIHDGIAAARGADLTSFTLGSAEIFRREVAAIAEAAQAPNANEQELRDRLTDATLALVSKDMLLSPIPVERSWVTASTEAYGNGESAAANGWRLFDGDLTTSVDTTVPNGSVTVTPPAGTILDVTGVEIYPRGGWLAQRLVGHKFQGSNDGGATWQTFATVQSATDGQWTGIELSAPVNFSQIRMLDDHGGYTNAAEARLITRAADASLVDLLLADASALNEADYSTESWASLQAAVAEAAAVDRADQSALDASAGSLRSAIEGLEPPRVSAVVTITSADEPSTDGWYQKSVLVTLAPREAGQQVQYSINGGKWRTYKSAIPVSEDGRTAIGHRVLQNGVVVPGSTTETIVKVDMSSPSATVNVAPSSGRGTPLNPVTVSFSAIDPRSGLAAIEYRLNDGAWTTVTGELVLDQVGDHVVSYRASDRAGNVSPVKSVKVKVID